MKDYWHYHWPRLSGNVDNSILFMIFTFSIIILRPYFENVDEIILIEPIIPSQIHENNLRSFGLKKMNDSKSHTISNSILLSSRKPGPLLVLSFVSLTIFLRSIERRGITTDIMKSELLTCSIWPHIRVTSNNRSFFKNHHVFTFKSGQVFSNLKSCMTQQTKVIKY